MAHSSRSFILNFKAQNKLIRSLIQRALITLFVFIIYAPILAELAPSNSWFVEIRENRRLASLPHVPNTLAEWRETPRILERYFEDHFKLRGVLIQTWNWLLFQISGSIQRDVILGKDGWLFFVEAQNRNRAPFSDSELAAWKAFLHDTKKRASSQGIDFYFMIAPNPQTIYGEYLPTKFQNTYKNFRIGQLQAVAQSLNISFVDPTHDLKSQKQNGTLYYKTDTHWNDLGGLVAYQTLLTSISNQLPIGTPLTRADFKISEKQEQGLGLAIQLGIQNILKEKKIRLDPVKAFEAHWSQRGSRIGESSISQCEHCPPFTALVVHDSFFESIMPFLNEHFRTVAYDWEVYKGFDWCEVARLRPSILIFEKVERYLGPPPPVPSDLVCEVPLGS